MPLLDLKAQANLERRLQIFLRVCLATAVLAVTYHAENLAHQLLCLIIDSSSTVSRLQSDFGRREPFVGLCARGDSLRRPADQQIQRSYAHREYPQD